MIFEYNIISDDVLKYITINDILIKKLYFSTRLKSKLIKSKNILCNGKIVNTNSKINLNDVISIDFSYFEDNSNIIPTEMNLDIVYEDEWLLILNKPPKMSIHPSTNHVGNSLSNSVKYYFDTIGLNKKIRPVNRLDIDTSGLTVFAKCEYIQGCFSKQMSENIFQKEYLCITNTIPKEAKGIINLPIGRNDNSIIERCICQNGKPSITHYEILKSDFEKNIALVKCILKTGRTHQIRVHMKSIGSPLLGDTLYGSTSPLIDRQALHSHILKFIHPITHIPMTFVSNIPIDMNIF